MTTYLEFRLDELTVAMTTVHKLIQDVKKYNNEGKSIETEKSCRTIIELIEDALQKTIPKTYAYNANFKLDKA